MPFPSLVASVGSEPGLDQELLDYTALCLTEVLDLSTNNNYNSFLYLASNVLQVDKFQFTCPYKSNKESYPGQTKNLTEIVNLYFANKGELDSRNPNPPDLACTEPGPLPANERAKSKAVSKRREGTTSLSPTQLCNPKHVVTTLLLGQKTAAWNIFLGYMLQEL